MGRTDLSLSCLCDDTDGDCIGHTPPNEGQRPVHPIAGRYEFESGNICKPHVVPWVRWSTCVSPNVLYLLKLCGRYPLDTDCEGGSLVVSACIIQFKYLPFLNFGLHCLICQPNLINYPNLDSMLCRAARSYFFSFASCSAYSRP